ncbi:MAG: hypothetical protein U1E22_10265 [Coriobacteriia bacterium]|nr:hypothetical protein [Coriobacteriia bacterium]
MASSRSRGSDVVRALLRGGSGLAVGFSLVPQDAVAGLMWGHPGQSRFVAACSDLELDFAFMPAWEPGAALLAQTVARCGTAVFWTVAGPLGRVARERGWSRTIADTARHTEDMAQALDRATEAAAHEIASAPPECVVCVIAEDLVGGSGPLYAPDYVFSELLPRLGQLAAAALAHGMDPVLHSDGDTRVFTRTIASAGFLGLHIGGVSCDTFETIYASARAAGLAVIGGLSGDDLRSGAARAIRAGTHAGTLAVERGLLIADDGGLTTSEEVAALVAAIEAARRSTVGEERL